MKYKELNDKMKAQVDILLETGFSMREAGRRLHISHSTISRYKSNDYTKRTIDIHKKYFFFIEFLESNYDFKTKSIEVCVHNFKRYHPRESYGSVQQVYNWINEGKLSISPQNMCYKRSKRKKRASGMMNHLQWNIENKTVLPIRLRPKYIEERTEIGHLEIDSIIGKRNEYTSIISIVDRCSRMLWLIKSEGSSDYYTTHLIRRFTEEHNICTKSITVDNGLEFRSLGITAKRLGVKLDKCDPYCSFQRGSNERANALVRRFIPKGVSLYKYEQQ